MDGWLYKHENITNSASNSVAVGAGAELGKKINLCPTFQREVGGLKEGQMFQFVCPKVPREGGG